MQQLEKVVDFLVRVLRVIGGACLALMMLVTCLDVFLRAAFNRPISGSVDIVQFLAVIVLAAAMPYTHRQGGHVGVNLLVQRLQPRSQAIVDVITSSIALVLFAIVTWQMWLYASELWKKGEVSMTIQIPVHPFTYAVSVCFGILCLTLLLDVIRLTGKAVKG